jgi:acetyl coenzyme A synthetase (ADP forming)-like protein
VILRNLLESGFQGDVYPINPTADVILDHKCYPGVNDVPGPIECAVIAVPTPLVAKVMRECAEKGIKGAVVITSGFAEVGNVAGEQEIAKIAKDNDICMIGPNCLGILNPATRVDNIFLPMYKLERPKVGEIAFIAQSGAVGSCVVDLAADSGVGISKFISYGNAAVVNETHLLEYLGQDKRTKVIAAYIETVKEGKRFLEIAREVTKKKPIILVKAGKTKGGMKAAASHTAAMAGAAEVYSAVFRQARIIEVESLTDLFDYSKIFLQPMPKRDRVAVITNGGGVGVLTADWVEMNNLKLADFTDATKEALRKSVPQYVNITNPLDLAGDADSARYKAALDLLMADDSIDSIICILLLQTVSLDPRVVDVVIAASEQRKKPVIAISIGGEYTRTNRAILESSGVPTYTSPYVASRALAKLTWYSNCMQRGACQILG